MLSVNAFGSCVHHVTLSPFNASMKSIAAFVHYNVSLDVLLLRVLAEH